MARSHLTYSTAVVLLAIARGRRYGFDVMDATGLPSGTVYPILRRLERNGMLRSNWENDDVARSDQRPQRRYYQISRHGEEALETAIQRFRGLDRLFDDADAAAARS